MIPWLLKAGKAKLVAATLAALALTALLDWSFGKNISLAAIYILPMMIGALFLKPHQTAVFALLCSYLRSGFETSGPPSEIAVKFIFAALAYLASGLFVTELVRNHKLVIQNLERVSIEQSLRHEAEEQLRVLAESSPAAILTLDGEGNVLAANGAALHLLSIPEGQNLTGRSIHSYLPVLSEAIALDLGPGQWRTAAQCQGTSDNGEIFLAHMWFSSYSIPAGRRLAAIVVDSSEDLRAREEQSLTQLLRGNRIAAAAVAHEVRNSCGAMALLCASLGERHSLNGDHDLRALVNLVDGLEYIASIELRAQTHEEMEDVSLREVLDSLRIVVEPDWREIEGTLRWRLPDRMPSVVAERHGLLQAFLNLAKNSHRAVRDSAARDLTISVSLEGPRAIVRFQDSGPGVARPEQLFQPFQEEAAGSGIGLYVSRSLVRSYGGDLRFEPQSNGTCFAVELQSVRQEEAAA